MEERVAELDCTVTAVCGWNNFVSAKLLRSCRSRGLLDL